VRSPPFNEGKEMYFAIDPTNPAEVSDKLVEIVSESHVPNWTAVIDSAFDYGRGQCDFPGSPEALYACDDLDAMLEVSPFLVPLMTESPAMLKEQLLGLTRHCGGRPMFSVVASSCNAAELKPNWQKCARVMTDDGQRMLLRFADTRVLPVLSEVIRHESWAALTHELNQWWYIDRAGRLEHVPVVDSGSAPVFPLAVGKREINQLLERGEPDSVIDALSVEAPEILPASNKAAFFEQIKLVCEFARARDIDAFPDIVALGAFDTMTNHQGLTDPKLLKLVTDRAWTPGELALKLAEIAR